MNIFYLNGKFVKEKDAKISVYDLGFLRGYAVFDFLRTYNRKPFYLKEHLQRLLNSAKIIGLKHNFTLKKLESLVFKTLNKNKHLREANLRIYLTGGEAKNFLTPTKPKLYILITPIEKPHPKLYQKGAKLITKFSERILPSAKTIVYTEGIKFLQEAKQKGAVEVLLINKENKITEGIASNFFAVINKKLITPKENILLGITRQVVIFLAKKLKIEVIERDISFDEIKKFDESFITATNKEILPIIKIDHIKIGKGEVGEMTKLLMKEFKKLTQNY